MKPLVKATAFALLMGAALSAAGYAAAQPHGRWSGRYHGGYGRYYGPGRVVPYPYGGPIFYGPYGAYDLPPEVAYPAPPVAYPAPYPYPAYPPYAAASPPAAPAPAREVRPASVRPAAHRDFIVYFPFDGDQLTGEAQGIVRQAVQYAQARPGSHVTVVGYTDAAGTEGYNQNLSQRRSEAVRQALAANGVARGGIEMAWRGKHGQAVKTADGVREQANRRVTIEISGGEGTTAYQGRVPNPARP
jgi:outer membrane protein OmpA-like peptidoglycan-associated protein